MKQAEADAARRAAEEAEEAARRAAEEERMRVEAEEARARVEAERKHREEVEKLKREQEELLRQQRAREAEEEEAKRLEEEEIQAAKVEADARALLEFESEKPDAPQATGAKAATLRKRNNRREKIVDKFLEGEEWAKYEVRYSAKDLAETPCLQKGDDGLLVVCGEGLALQTRKGALVMFYRYSRLEDFAACPQGSVTMVTMKARPSRGPIKTLYFTVPSSGKADASIIVMDCHLRSQVWGQ